MEEEEHLNVSRLVGKNFLIDCFSQDLLLQIGVVRVRCHAVKVTVRVRVTCVVVRCVTVVVGVDNVTVACAVIVPE